MKFALRAVSALLAAVAVLAQPSPSAWRAFRQQYPFHIQGIALSPPDARGSRTLVVAEPPPATTKQSLSTVDGALHDGTVV